MRLPLEADGSGRTGRVVELPPPRGEHVIYGPRDIELPLRAVRRRVVSEWEIWDVEDSLGRLCASGPTEWVNGFIKCWG